MFTLFPQIKHHWNSGRFDIIRSKRSSSKAITFGEEKITLPKGSDNWKSELSLQLDKFGVFQFTYHLDSNFSCYYEPVFLLYTPVSLQLNDLLYSSSHCGHLLISHQHAGAGANCLFSGCWFPRSWLHRVLCLTHCLAPGEHLALWIVQASSFPDFSSLSLPLVLGLILFPFTYLALFSLCGSWVHPLPASLKWGPLAGCFLRALLFSFYTVQELKALESEKKKEKRKKEPLGLNLNPAAY